MQTNIKNKLTNKTVGLRLMIVMLVGMYAFPCHAQRQSIVNIYRWVDHVTFDTGPIRKAAASYNEYKEINISITDDDVILGNRSLKRLMKQEDLTDTYEWLDYNKLFDLPIDAYELITPRNKYYLIASGPLGPAGLIVNFQIWEVIHAESGETFSFASLCMEPEFIFYNPDTETLQFIEVRFGDYFFYYRDWHKIDFTVKINEVDDNNVVWEKQRFDTWDKTFRSTVDGYFQR